MNAWILRCPECGSCSLLGCLSTGYPNVGQMESFCTSCGHRRDVLTIEIGELMR